MQDVKRIYLKAVKANLNFKANLPSKLSYSMNIKTTE